MVLWHCKPLWEQSRGGGEGGRGCPCDVCVSWYMRITGIRLSRTSGTMRFMCCILLARPRRAKHPHPLVTASPVSRWTVQGGGGLSDVPLGPE